MNKSKQGRPKKYNWQELKTGDSFILDCNKEEARSVIVSGAAYFRNIGTKQRVSYVHTPAGYKFTVIEKEPRKFVTIEWNKYKAGSSFELKCDETKRQNVLKSAKSYYNKNGINLRCSSRKLKEDTYKFYIEKC